MHVQTLLHCRWLLTMAKHRVFDHQVVAVDQGRIVAVVPESEANQFEAQEHISLDKHVLLPGFVNAHTHLAMNLFKGCANDIELMPWLQEYIWPAEKAVVSAEFVYDGTMLAIAELIRSGTTCFNDMYFFPESVLQAAKKVGIRGRATETLFNFPVTWSQSYEVGIERILHAHQFCHGNALLDVSIGPHSPYATDTAILSKIREVVKAHDLPVTMHLQESASELKTSFGQTGKRPLHCLHEFDLLNDQFQAVHMTHINDDDIALCAKYGAHIVHCPESNYKINSGTAEVNKMLLAGINVALGTDGAVTNNDLNMLGEMQAAALIGKAVCDNPTVLNAWQVLEMATINGAKAMNLENEIGTITPGKSADFIAIDLSAIETQPLYDVTAQLIYAASRSQISHSWVAGQCLMRDRELMTISIPEILETTEHWRQKVVAAFKPQPELA